MAMHRRLASLQNLEPVSGAYDADTVG